MSIVFLALVVWFGLMGLGAYLAIRRRRKTAGPMACGACGYPVRGLTVMTCPECGADLRVVGIKPVETTRNGVGVLFAVVFTAVMLGMCLVFGLFASRQSVSRGPTPPTAPLLRTPPPATPTSPAPATQTTQP